jgi:hypothetical protein
MAINFQRDDQGAWLYLKQEGIYELEVNITKLPDATSELWCCDILFWCRAPSDYCSALNECDYGGATLTAGILIPCKTCEEKTWAPTFRSVSGIQAREVVLLARAELAALNRSQNLSLIRDVINDTWKFKQA